jgi:NADH:ubiquinone oxidoreductase subunit 6 (subunit J)
LFKKCSWLPVLDVIIPGVTLSFLRVYDENKSSKWGGIYTISGNITFIISTIIWIGIEIVDPYSFPFSLVTCPLLMLVIFVISWRRNDWVTLLRGQFEQGYDLVDE